MGVFTESSTFDAVAILVTIIVGIIAYCKWKLSYWDKMGLPTLTPTLPFGNTKDLLLGRKTFGEQFRDLYRTLKQKGYRKHAGVYLGIKPFYVTIDPELIKHIMQKDFQHFVNHGFYINEENDPLTGHLFNLEDAKWRTMRVKLTPTFTSGKIKMMFQTLADCSVGLKDIMDESASNHAPVDIKEILGRFTTDIIGSVAFGLECNSLKDPDAEFRKYGRRVFEVTNMERIKALIQFAVPHRILDAIKFKTTKPDVEKFFMKVVLDTVNYREKNNLYRKDFMHLLLQLKNRGAVTEDEKIKDDNGKTTEKALTMNELTAQAFVFFLAGFETSSTTMTFALYELATSPDVQEKLREEINTVLDKHNNKLTYDGLMEMTYMDKVLNETLRKHPPVPMLNRRCTKNYTIPGTSIVIKKGIDIVIPVLGLHTDPEYYPNPEKFDPERFSEELKHSRPAYTWIPFGEGPRICIGMRFGLLQSKVGLATLLKNYKITLSKKTVLPLKLDKNSFVTTAAGGIWIDVEKLD
ncbi:probable cytochrome P450 6a14 [Zophobas morio]|uniref:probable cytochrome P450 6a14 n=1 Tax=Zophobas morio TaxID=2755281 RepID=UPI0030837EE1